MNADCKSTCLPRRYCIAKITAAPTLLIAFLYFCQTAADAGTIYVAQNLSRYCNKLWIGSFQAAFTWGLIPSMN
jgi:hypothetical protein